MLGNPVPSTILTIGRSHELGSKRLHVGDGVGLHVVVEFGSQPLAGSSVSRRADMVQQFPMMLVVGLDCSVNAHHLTSSILSVRRDCLAPTDGRCASFPGSAAA